MSCLLRHSLLFDAAAIISHAAIRDAMPHYAMRAEHHFAADGRHVAAAMR